MRLALFPRREKSQPPRYCPACGNDLSAYPYYQLVPSPFARKLLAFARLLLPVMTGVFLVLFFSGNFLKNFSGVSGYFILAFICSPSLLIYSVTLLIPRMRRVLCLRCSWYRDFFYRPGPLAAAPQGVGPAEVPHVPGD